MSCPYPKMARKILWLFVCLIHICINAFITSPFSSLATVRSRSSLAWAPLIRSVGVARKQYDSISPFSTRTATEIESWCIQRQFLSSRQTYPRRNNKKTRLYIGGRPPPSKNRDFYAILGISRNADITEIKRAYRNLAKQYHPDTNPNIDTTEKFQEINRAYEVLSDDAMRKRYDQFGEAGIGTSAASEKQGVGNPFGGPGGAGGFGAEVDLGDIFDTFFGGGRGAGGASGFGARPGGGGGAAAGAQQRAASGPVPGDDLRFDLEIDFNTACFGGEEKVRIRHLERCGTCGGNGVKPGSSVSTCRACGGGGVTVQVTRTPLGNFQTQQTCPTCRGTGKKVDEYCGTCGGKGLSQKAKQIKVTIPPGVEEGNKLRVRGEGDAGASSGPTGASIKVPVIDGEVKIKIPPGTQPGQVMRLKGNGAPRLGNANQRGDHYVTINVEIPKETSHEEEELVKKLKELSKAKSDVFQ